MTLAWGITFTFFMLGAMLGSTVGVAGQAGDTTEIGFSGQPFAELTVTVGQVEIQPGGEGDWTAVEAPHSLYVYDRVRTGADSRAAVVFHDESEMRLAELTTLEITPRFDSEEEASGIFARVRIFFGQIFNRSQPGQSSLEFETPDAVAAVRGTHFFLRVDSQDAIDRELPGRMGFETWRSMYPFESRLVVRDGLVAFFNEYGQVLVGEGESSQSSSHTAPTDPVPAGEDEIQALDEAFDEVFGDQDIDVGSDPAAQRGGRSIVWPFPAQEDEESPLGEVDIDLIEVQPWAFNPMTSTTTFTAALSRPVAWRVRIVEDAADQTVPVRTFQGEGDGIEIEWDGTDASGTVVPDGAYFLVVDVLDDASEGGVSDQRLVIVDTLAPELVAADPEDLSTLYDYPEWIMAWMDDTGSGIDPESLQAWINGDEVSVELNAGDWGVLITPEAGALLEGSNEVLLRVRDYAGNENELRWTFFLHLTELEVTDIDAKPGAFSPNLNQTIQLSAALSTEADWKWTIVRVEELGLWEVESMEGRGNTISLTWDGLYDPTQLESWDMPSWVHGGGTGGATVVQSAFGGNAGGQSGADAFTDGIHLFVVEARTSDGEIVAFNGIDFIIDSEPPFVEYASIEEGEVVTDVDTIQLIIVDVWSPVDLENVKAWLNDEDVTISVSKMEPSHDFPVELGYLAWVEADFDSLLPAGDHIFTLTFADDLGNEGEYELEFTIAGNPIVTGVSEGRIVLPADQEETVIITGADLNGATVLLSRRGSTGFPIDIQLSETDVGADGTSATLTLDGSLIKPGLYEVAAVWGDPVAYGPVDFEDGHTLLITRTDASGDHPSLIQARNDLARTGAGRGPRDVGWWSVEQITEGHMDLSSIVLTNDHYVLRTDAEVLLLSKTGVGGLGLEAGGAGLWAPAVAVMQQKAHVYYYEATAGAIRRTTPGAVSPDKLSIHDWVAVHDLLVHDGLFIAAGEMGAGGQIIVADALTFDVIDTLTFPTKGQADRLALFDGGLGSDPVVYVYGEKGVSAIDLVSLKPLWHETWQSVPHGPGPVIAVDNSQSQVYALVYTGQTSMLYGYDASTGHRWLNEDLATLDVGSHPIFHEDGLAVANGHPYVLVTSGSAAVFAWLAGPGSWELVWFPEWLGDNLMPGPIAVSPATEHAYAVIKSDAESLMYVIDLDHHDMPEEIWLVDLINEPDMDVSTILAADDALFAIVNGNVYRLFHNEAVGVHIVDPPLIKTANQAHAAIGDVITYTITFDNTQPIDHEPLEMQANVWIQDVLPAGFVYVEGSSYIYPDGIGGAGSSVQVADPEGTQTLYWELASPTDSIEIGGRRSLTYQAMVGPRVSEGIVHTNRAVGFFDGDGDGVYAAPCAPGDDPVVVGCDFPLTNVARAEVYVTTGVFTPQTIITGKVFHDRNGDGRQDPSEPGLAGVWIVTERGVTILTDENGMFHLAGLSTGRHVLKLDENTLPEGTRVVGRGATRLLDTALGGLYTVNFIVEGE